MKMDKNEINREKNLNGTEEKKTRTIKMQRRK
jgi:hypothetical protein